MEVERDAARNSLMTVLVLLLVLSFVGLLAAGQVLKAPPKEFAGQASGSVSLCFDNPPDLELNNLTAAVNVTFTYNVSENITSNPGGFPIYYYFQYNEVPNPNFTINWTTGVINLTPNSNPDAVITNGLPLVGSLL